MPLETFTNPNKPINIRDISKEEVETLHQPYFVPEREITEEDWGEVNSRLEFNQRHESWYSFMSLLSDVAVIDPQRAALFLNEKNWETMQNWFIDTRNDGLLFSRCAAELANLDRNRASALLAPADWELIQRVLSESVADGISVYISQAADIARVDPSKLTALSENGWKAVMIDLEALRRQGRYDGFIGYAANASMVNYKKIIPFLTEEDWRHMVATYRSYKESGSTELIHLAAQLSTLARFEQRFHGKIQNSSSQPTPLPEIRKF